MKKNDELGYDEFGETTGDDKFNVDDFLQNNDILKRIQALRMNTLKRKLRARAKARQIATK